MLLKTPFTLPDDFLPRFGYPGGRRFVALYWEPCGDESCYDDGVSSACGMTDNWLFLEFLRRPDVDGWLRVNGLFVGSSDREAAHWLVADGQTGAVYVGHWREARQVVIGQGLPG
jgi:hypothetical protein